MKIFIVGLGLIGASLAEGLHQKGHHIRGYDQNESIMNEAKKLGFVSEDSNLNKLKEAELVILALYPKDNVSFLENHQNLFAYGQTLTDVSGTKVWMMENIENLLPEGVSYTSVHPMAGREISGFHARSAHLFTHANLMIVKSKKSIEKDETLIRKVASDLNFGKITVTDAHTHDQLVAFTSQLTHVIAVCLMHADHEKNTKEATGDSFRDLTRIAKINEMMWSELFLENKEVLINMIELFENELDRMKSMIKTHDQDRLITYLRQAKEKRKDFDIH